MAKKEKKYSGRSGAAARASGRNVDRPDIQARKSAAQSMQRAGVQSLSGLSGSQGQVARFKTEQNQLRNEYNDKNTSDDRKEEIVKDLRGVSRDLNNQSRAAALNQVIREFGPGSITNTGGIMGSDAGARFEQLRGNPNFYQDGRPGLETFVGNQGAFKTGDKNLFKQVHPNPLKVLLGAATQIGNLSPMGLVRNINKIRTGEPLIDMSFMDRNKSESPSRMKDFYGAYMEGMNKKIADLKSSKNADQFDAVPLDPQFQDVEAKNFGEFLGDPTRLAEDKDIQEDMERSLLNQYSLLEDPGLADTLLDDTEETDLAEEINPSSGYQGLTDDEEEQQYNEMVSNMGIGPTNIPDYEQEFIDTFGVPMKGDITAMSLTDGSPVRGLGDRLTRERFALDNNIPLDQIGEVYPKVTTYPVIQGSPGLSARYGSAEGDFSSMPPMAAVFDPDIIFSDKVSNTPKLGQEIRSADFSNLGYKDGGSVNTYDVLKLINDTMNDG